MEKATSTNEKKTKVLKGFHGTSIETRREENGKTYDITTSKVYSGSIVTTATEIDVLNDGCIQMDFMSISEPFFKMNHGKHRATEKTLLKFHYEALTGFDLKANSQEEREEKEEDYKCQKGDILFLDGYGKGQNTTGNRGIIYEIIKTDFSTIYKTVDVDTLELKQNTYPKNYAKKFGIGTYYIKGYNAESLGIDTDQLTNMLIDAQQVKKDQEEKQRKEEQEQTRKRAEKEKYLSQFKKADARKTTSLIKSYILKTFKTVQKVSITSDTFSGGDSIHVTYYAPEKLQELENFVDSLQEGSFNSMEDIYENHQDKAPVIIDNYILYTRKWASARLEKVEPKEDPKKDSEINIEADGIEIFNYSAKSFAVIGDTKPIKDTLKSLGGRFNFRLSCGAGWIFKIDKLEEVKKALNL